MVTRKALGGTTKTRAGAVIPSSSLDASAEAADGRRGRLARHLDQVLLLDAEGRVGEPVGEVAVVGEEQETLGVGVEAADGEHARLVGHELDDRAPALRIVRRGHHPGRLVEEVVHEVGGGRYPDAVDLDAVALRVDPAPQLGHLAVDGDAAVLDELLAHPPAAEAGTGEDLLEPLALRFARRYSASARSPCSRASMTSGPGTNSASGGRSSRESRPSFSRNSRLVPYRTAWPGPGSRATSST